jgi:predicted metalloprotease
VGAAQCWSNAAFPPLPATTDMTAMKEKVLRDYTEPPINSTETTIGECEACGRRRPIQEVKDPFMNEGTIDDDGSMRRWCYPCYSQRCDEMR